MKDVFICHAGDDKEDVVYPLVATLKERGITAWLDRAEINWGDSLVEKINDGLSNSRYVIVILSENFLAKRWPQRELNSVLNIEASTGEVKVLPLIVGEASDIVHRFTLLNDKNYLQWNGNPAEVADALQARLRESQEEGATGKSGTSNPDIPVPKVKRRVTQREKDQFVKRAFGEVLSYFKEGLAKLESHHEGIEADLDEVHKFKFVCKIYLDGEIAAECKVWLGGMRGNDIAYVDGRGIDINNDNSYSDWLSVDDDESEAFLNPSGMGVVGDSDEEKITSGESAARYLWRRFTANLE